MARAIDRSRDTFDQLDLAKVHWRNREQAEPTDFAEQRQAI